MDSGRRFALSHLEILEEQIPAMTQTHYCCLLLIELALFFRGCIVQATSLTWHAFQIPKSQDGKRMRLKCLLRWKATCNVCGGILTLPKGMLAWRPLSISTKDKRIGNPAVRSEISSNRHDVYACLYVMFVWKGYSKSLAPFFFYFSTLSHLRCKLERGKEAHLSWQL